MAVPPTPANAAHLLRRAAWGGLPPEIEQVVDDGIEGAVDRLLDPAPAPVVAEPVATPGFFPYDGEAVMAWFVQLCARSPTPAIERLLWFWHGHFATSLEKVEAPEFMVRQFLTLRRFGLGRFDDLLGAMAHDPAMNVWLDLHLSVAGNVNENFAREVLELFSMGASNGYTQHDVVEAARAFTGHALALDPVYEREVDVRLVPSLHDFGTKTFLGVTGPHDGTDIVAIVVERPECHRFVAERLWHRYAGTAPPPEVIDDLAAAFATRLEIRDLLGALLTHPRFYDDDVKAGLVAQPVEVVIRTLRGFGLVMPDLTVHSLEEIEGREDELFADGALHPGEIIDWLATMGQLPALPPNVGGWPHNDAWLDSNRSAGRLLAGTRIAERLIHESPVADHLLAVGASGPGPLTAELMARFGREHWSETTEAAIAAALGGDLETGLVAAIAVAFTSPEVTLA